MESKFWISTFWLLSIGFLIVLFYPRWATCGHCLVSEPATKTYGFLTAFTIIYLLFLIASAQDLYQKTIWPNIYFGGMIGFLSALLAYVIKYGFLISSQINEGTAVLEPNAMFELLKYIGIESFLRGTWLFGALAGIVSRIAYKTYMGE